MLPIFTPNPSFLVAPWFDRRDSGKALEMIGQWDGEFFALLLVQAQYPITTKADTEPV